ncbi:carbon-nitrogen family hydrolase [Branchiibius sp. NY16-3462-2]|uniref:carbon-nitrogen family hydrolase n=1 Tax=Branchiibius sp. NY16-3462-2 TaxID=1807500 RepID=UPI00079C2972|nr:carbon-nitrogen family hydrolase [Branchiibius sp. NY16-3462-2]KYH45031.1 apolipoprotein acyltransferase [Branchiibius sp. NY16-3462-2]
MTRVAVVQLAYDDAEPPPARLARVASLVSSLSGHDLIVLPELWYAGGFSYRQWPEYAQPLDGPVAQELSALAASLGCVLHGGSIVERGPVGPEGKDLWNTSLVFGPDGSLLASYRKIHRFGFAVGEPSLMEAGSSVVTMPLFDTTAGLSTCYDLRFPELYRAQLDAGATVFLIPSAWPLARVSHWRTLLKARAIEDQCLVIACNTAGTHANSAMGGHSAVISASGEVLAEAGTSQEVLSLEVSLDDVARIRSDFPVLKDRRL